MMQKLIDNICSLANGKAVGLDGISVDLFKIALNDDPPCDKDCSRSSLAFEGGGDCNS